MEDLRIRRFEMDGKGFHRMGHLLPDKQGDPGVTVKDNRLFMDAVLWVARTGAPWVDLPERFEPYDTAFQRFNRWAKKGVWGEIMEALGGYADLEALLIDSTAVRVHKHDAGAQKKRRSGYRAIPRRSDDQASHDRRRAR